MHAPDHHNPASPQTGHSSPADHADREYERHRMQCLDVWGGNSSTNTAVSMPGLDAWVFSEPAAPTVAGNPSDHGEPHAVPGDAAHPQASEPESPGGGDIHYVSSCSTGRITRVMVADVAGHGPSVSRAAIRLRDLLRRYQNHVEMTSLVRGLNREFGAMSEAGVFATAVAATYWAPTRQVILCNAGHPRPMHFVARERRWVPVLGRPLGPGRAGAQPKSAGPANVPLGITDSASYTATTISLDPDDLLLLYTDSFLESRSPSGSMLGEAGLSELLGRLDPSKPEGFIPGALQLLAEHRGGGRSEDDITALLLCPRAFHARPAVQDLVTFGKTMGRAIMDGLRPGGPPIPWPNLVPTRAHDVEHPEYLRLPTHAQPQVAPHAGPTQPGSEGKGPTPA